MIHGVTKSDQKIQNLKKKLRFHRGGFYGGGFRNMLFVSELFNPQRKNSGKIPDLVSYLVQMVWFNDCVFEACKGVDLLFKLQNGMIDVWKLD